MMGPINIIALLGFWGTVGRMFTLRQGKRLFGLIDTGQIIGIIVSSYAIPVLLSYAFSTRDLLYISAVSVGVGLLVQFVIVNRFKLGRKTEEQAGDKVEAKSPDSRFIGIFRNRYIGVMSLFFALLIAVTIVVHFAFYAVVKENYPNPVDLAAFLGYFNGTLMIFSILIKTFLYGWLMKTWGLRVTLVISPIMILFFTVVAAVIGSIFGYTALAAGFTFFFLIIAVSKLFTKSLQDSIVAPSMKILYQSLDAKIRYSVQARIDGTINEIAVLLASLVLAGLGAVSFFGLIHIIYFLAALLIVWGIVSFRLYKAYQDSLNQSLAKYQQAGEEETQEDFRSVLEGAMKQEAEPVIHNALSFIERIDFAGFLAALGSLLGSTSKRIRGISLKKIAEQHIPVTGKDLLDKIRGENSGENKEIAGIILERIGKSGSGRISRDDLLLMAKSPDPKQRLAAGMYLFNIEKFDHHAVLNTLLRDPDPAVKNLAIEAAKNWKVIDTVPVLIDFLSSSYYRQAFEALVQIGEGSVELLEQSHYKSGVTQQTLNRVTRILGKIGGEAAISSLVNKINYQNREVEAYALRALRDLDYQATELVMPAIIDGIKSAVQHIAWYIAAQHTVQENTMGDPLEPAINEELKHAQDHLYLLLSLAYDPSSIHHIRENLESGTSEGIGFAIELLDIFVADEVKPVLFPVLDDTTTVEKIRHLQAEFPIVILEPYELLLGIINRDPNYVNPVTKAAAIQLLESIEDVSVSDDLVAQVFNPDELLSELAAVQLQKMDSLMYEKVLDRLAPDKRSGLKKSLRSLSEGEEALIWNRVEFIKNNPLFADLPSILQYRIAGKMARIRLEDGQEVKINGATGGTGLVMVRSGEMLTMLNNKEIGKLSPQDLFGILPFMIAEKDLLLVKAKTASELYAITQENLDELIFDYEEMAMVMYRWAKDQQNQMGKLTRAMVS
jgi:hypothetical protein